MRSSILRILSALTLAAPLFGCGGSWFDEPRAAWRSEVEARCVASGRVKETEFVKAEPELNGPGSCGADHPYRVYAALLGTVWLSEPVLMNCPLTAAFDDWLNEIVQPQAMALFGVPVAEIKTFGTYSCRRIDNRTIGAFSEHSFLNAIDVAGFKLVDGREFTVLKDWYSQEPAIRAFLHRVGAESCKIFTVAIGPEGDKYHRDHLHLDLSMRRSGKSVCKAGASDTPMSYAPGDYTSSILQKNQNQSQRAIEERYED
jgi:hypothetical protein